MQTLELTNDEVLTIRDDGVSEGWERWFLLASDLHTDNPYCRRDLIARDFDDAAAKQAKILLFGDTFCAMGGKYDPRRNKSEIRPENNNEFYLDSLVDNNYAFLSRWQEWIKLLSDGNHETAIAEHCETDLTGRLADKLGSFRLGFAGLVRFLFSAGDSNRTQRRAYFHHGAGGGGEMTKGVPRVVREAAYLPDADIVIGGHIHESWIVRLARTRFTNSGKRYTDYQTHVQLPTYKDEYNLRSGYHIKNKRPPKPLGAAFLRFFWDTSHHGNVNYQIYSTN